MWPRPRGPRIVRYIIMSESGETKDILFYHEYRYEQSLTLCGHTKMCSRHPWRHPAHPCMLSHSALLKGRSSPRTFSWPIVDLSPEYACPG